jgi:hypothetical protein
VRLAGELGAGAVIVALGVLLATNWRKNESVRAVPVIESKYQTITPSMSLPQVERRFGRPTQSYFQGGKLIQVYVSRRHNWTIVFYVHPEPRSQSVLAN